MSNNTPLDTENREQVTTTTHSLAFDPIADSVSEELITAVATLNDTDPAELVLLADCIDPDALDALFKPRMDGTPRETNGQVEFTYDSYHVTVDSGGTITLEYAESTTDS
ncbi:HalOD1 output domain-containing protein [Haladaptatus pallidirubidus]|uniref:Halobacterial output domain-containing protein n=1 Tax=Haladaptatus pallidirubidus TaxID=1008152 RepID=A0AAV3UPS2_9EURY|nr:HalOD1 output domain-containing protein [Haladaptatus pallidirubidus]